MYFAFYSPMGFIRKFNVVVKVPADPAADPAHPANAVWGLLSIHASSRV
jgi:hypothetical protein